MRIAVCLLFVLRQEYEYVMFAKYRGDDDTDGLITCKVANSILEPHFALKPVSRHIMPSGLTKIKRRLFLMKLFTICSFSGRDEKDE